MLRRIREALPLLPFFALVTIFLIVPTVTVIVSAFFVDGAFSFDRIAALFSETALSALAKSVLLSASINQPNGKDFLPLLKVKAKLGQAFIVAGQKYKSGILVLVIRVVR